MEIKSFTRAEKGVCEKELSKTRRSFLPYLQIRPCGVRNRFGENRSNQKGNSVAHLLRSFLFKLVSTLGRCLATEAWFPQTRTSRSCYAVTHPVNFDVLLWYSTRLSWASKSDVSASE